MLILFFLYAVLLLAMASYQLAKFYKKGVQKYHWYFALSASAFFLLLVLFLKLLEHRLALEFPMPYLSQNFSPLASWSVGYEVVFAAACYLSVAFLKNEDQRFVLKLVFVALILWRLIANGTYLYGYYQHTTHCFETTSGAVEGIVSSSATPIITPDSLFLARLSKSLKLEKGCE